MKLWHKILLTCLVLYALAFHAASIYFLSTTHLANLAQETARAFSDQAIIRERVEAGIQVSGMPADPELLMQRYAAYYRYLNVELDLYQISTNTLYGQLDPAALEPDLLTFSPFESQGTASGPLVQKASVSRLEDDGQSRRRMHVSSPLRGEPDYLLLYTRDITDLYDRRSDMIKAFITIDLLTAIMLGLTAYFIARRLTRPLELLGQAAGQVADGHYSNVVPESKDETAELVKAFNRMSGAVMQREMDLERLASQRQQFIDNLTHEINTPLTSIQGYATLLGQARLNESQKSDAAAVIESEARRLRGLSDSLTTLMLARKTDLKLEPLSLEHLFRDVARTMVIPLREHGIELKAEPIPLVVQADASLLMLLMTNLVRNSIAASDAGSVITIKARHLADGRTEISVSDQGFGLPPDQLERIFEPFYRVDRSRSRQTGGTGLGLALCREIALRHGGVLTAESTLGQGTTMRLLLPA